MENVTCTEPRTQARSCLICLLADATVSSTGRPDKHAPNTASRRATLSRPTAAQQDSKVPSRQQGTRCRQPVPGQPVSANRNHRLSSPMRRRLLPSPPPHVRPDVHRHSPCRTSETLTPPPLFGSGRPGESGSGDLPARTPCARDRSKVGQK